MIEKSGYCETCGARFTEPATTKKWNPATCDLCGGKIVTSEPDIEDRTYEIGYQHACGYRD